VVYPLINHGAALTVRSWAALLSRIKVALSCFCKYVAGILSSIGPSIVFYTIPALFSEKARI
jgi:hypothetical protein